MQDDLRRAAAALSAHLERDDEGYHALVAGCEQRLVAPLAALYELTAERLQLDTGRDVTTVLRDVALNAI